MATKESENFYRLVALLVDIGTEVIRRLFLKYAVTPPTVTSVTQFLVQEKNTIARLVTKGIVGPAQLALLQPPPGHVVDPQLWDISLFCILLKNICPITQVEKSEIDTVRTVRNQIYGHRATAATSDVDILNHWGAVETSIKAIAHSCNDVDFENHVTKYIDSVKNGPLDIESIIQVLKQWSENEGIIQSKVDGVNETLDDVSATVKAFGSEMVIRSDRLNMLLLFIDTALSTLKRLWGLYDSEMIQCTQCFERNHFRCLEKQITKSLQKPDCQFKCSQYLASRPKVADHVFENLKEQTRILLEYKRKQPFIDTKQFGEALSFLNKEGSVIISGKPGEGKTLIVYKLVERIGLSGRCMCLYSPSEWDHVDTDEIDIILLDDIFGKHQLDSSSLDSWMPVLKNMEAYLNNGQLKIVLTSRQNVLSEAKHKLDKLSVIKNNVIELTSGALTGDENHGILDVLLDHHKRDKSEVNIQKCCDVYKANIGFPYCSFLFAADKSLFYLREQFFARPQQFFKEALGALNKDTKVALLFLFYTQGRCSESDLKLSTKKTHSQNEETLTWISYLIGISDGEMSLARVRDILEELSGVNVTHLSKSFAFAHNIVYESVALMHGERYPEEVIEHCTWNFIIGCVTTVAKGAEAELVIGNHLYENLCLRFIDRTMSGKPLHRNFYDVRTHRAIQTRDVCTTLYKLLHKQGKLREFSTCFMHDNQQGFLYDYLHNKGEGEIPLLVEEAVPYLKCNCDPDEFCPCWKCNVRNNTASGACLTGDVHSYCLMLNEGITITSNNIRQACTGENPELLKLVISTVKGHGMFMPEDVCISKSLVEAKQSKIPEMYEILYAEGAVVMPLCVYGVITYGNVTLTAVDHFVKELKRNGKWDPTDFWLQKALEASVSLDDSDIRKLLIEEGLIYHRGCLLSAVKTKQLSKVRETVMGMKALGTWQPSDYIIEQEYIKYLIMLRRGETQPFTIPSPANKGINEALIVAMNYEDRSIYEYLLTEGVRLTMETLPPVVETGQLERVKEVIKELKDNGEWDVTERACTQAIFQAIHRNLTDTFDLLVTEGITCTMETLKSIVAKEDVTVKDVEEVASHIKRSDNWQPNSIYMQMALVEAFQKEDKSVFDYLMKNGPKLDPYSVMIAVYTQDINAVSMCLQSLKNSHNWDPFDLILNKCMEMTKETSPEIYAVLSDAGVTFSSESLLSAAAKNDTYAIMWTVNELIDSDKWSPQTDDKVTRSLEFMCQYSNKMMFNILQKKGAKLTQLGVFNIIQNSKSLWYDTGPENRKSIEGVPTLAALVVASLAKRFLIPAFQQKAITVYVRLIHALEETGILDSKDPLLHDALVAAVESGDILAYDIVTETGTEVTEEVVIKLLQGTKCSLRIEFPEMLMNRTYRTCVMQCLLESIRKKKTFMC